MATKSLMLFFQFRHSNWNILLLITVLIAGCTESNTYKPLPPPKVTVSQPIRREIIDYLEFTGNTQAVNTVKLRARVEGYLEKVLFNDGDRVKQGQPLFIIQQNTYEAKLQQAKADLLTQKARYQHALTEYTRYSKLLMQKAASQTDVDQWRYERDAAQAALLSAEAAVELAKLDLGYTKVVASFDGRIDRRLKDMGNLVGSGEATILAEVSEIDPIYVYFTINEKQLLRVINKSQLSLEQASDKRWPVYVGFANEKGFPYEGQLDFASVGITPTTGTLLVRGILPNPKGTLIPGLFARVRVPLGGKKPALLIPREALGFDQQGPYVLLVNEKHLVERRSVTLGTEMEGFRVIEKGLKGGESVIISGLLKAIPGYEVTPEKTELEPLGENESGSSQKTDAEEVGS